MALFRYVGTQSDGTPSQGEVLAVSIQEAVSRLQAQGVTVEEVSKAIDASDPLASAEVFRAAPPTATAAAEPSSHTEQRSAEGHYDEGPPTEARSRIETEFAGALVGGVPLSDLQFFFRQLSTMLNAGLGAAQAMDVLTQQTRHSKLKKVVGETRDHIIAGRPMTVGFQRYPEVFSPLMISMIRTGEEGGMVAEQTRMLADYIQRDIELRNIIRRETAYPKLVLGASVLIITATNIILQSIKPGSQGINSPLTTFGVLIVVIPLCIALLIGMKLAKQRPELMSTWHSFTASLPWIGDMIRGFAMARFGRAFGALYAAGVPSPKAFLLAADACGNEALRFKMQTAANDLENGCSMSEAFIRTKAFNPLVIDMVKTGEMTGNVDLMLNKMAEYYEDEGSTKARQSAMILGVLVFLAVALYVGFVIISFYTSMYGGMGAAAGG